MTVEHFPGLFRVGALNEIAAGVEDTRLHILEPKFLVLVLLRGRQIFYLDGERFELSANMGDDSGPVAFSALILEPCELRFGGSWGTPFRKISIAGPPDWFDQIKLESASPEGLPNFPNTHLNHRIWSPSGDIVRLTQQIILAPPEDSAKKTGLFRMSRALEILRRIPDECGTKVRTKPVQTSLKQANENLQERIRLHIMQNLSSDLSLAHLEDVLHLNRRSIQRCFKQGYGISLSEFIRQERLNKANRALQQDGISIARAAHIAGYSSSANFSTAFRRAFGVAPNHIRNRGV